jgi:hypothetical protein
VALLSLAGCGIGGIGGSNLLEVKGKVYYGDKLLTATGLSQAQVNLVDAGDQPGTAVYRGTIDESGNYSLKAPAGKFKVIVIATKEGKKVDTSSEFNYATPESVIPAIYGDRFKTGIHIDVKENPGPNDYDIKLPKI